MYVGILKSEINYLSMIYKKSWKYILIRDDFSMDFCLIYNLYRIKALKDFSDVKKGDIGGFIHSYHNLSHKENCWVYDNAIIEDCAKVSENATIRANAIIKGNISIHGTQVVSLSYDL